MKKKTSFFLIILVSLSLNSLYSNDPIQRMMDPFVPWLSDQGVDSLWVNPSGLADQTGFEFDFSVVTVADPDDIARFSNLMDIAKRASSGDISDKDVQAAAVKLLGVAFDHIDEDGYSSLMSGTTVDGDYALVEIQAMSIDERVSYFSGLSSSDQEQMVQNLQTNWKSTLNNLDITLDLGYGFQGTYGWNGIAVGLMHRGGMTFSIVDTGFEMILTETGLSTGYGLSLGDKMRIGGSLSYSLLTRHLEVPFQELGQFADLEMGFGHIWGLDAGLQYEPVDRLVFGGVVKNLLGSATTDDSMLITTLRSVMDGSAPSPFTSYWFNPDLHLGGHYTWILPWASLKTGVDFYNIFRDLYHEYDTRFSNRIRVGAELKFNKVVSVTAQYYGQYFSFASSQDLWKFHFEESFFVKADGSSLGGELSVGMRF